MQAIHCTSDAPFVVKRLGEERAQSGAYPWRSLLDRGAIIANGTDAPVELVDPIPNFYASVTRRRADTGQAFYPEQSMTRKEAINAYTLANAYAAFEEDIKGSISPGKWADLVLLSQNILNCAEDSILKTKVMMTMVGGKVKYEMSKQ
jgi:predicted amidohydrolase YtcJ